MNRGKKILFLLLINLGLVFVSLYLLDMLQIIDYKQIINQIPLIGQTYRVRFEDQFLLERSELGKKWQILDEKLRNFAEDRKKLDEEKRDLLAEREKLDKEKESIQTMLYNFSNLNEQKNAYDKKVEEVAIQIENMPPDNAVAILARQDDMMVIDVFKKMNKRADDEGRNSIVPYLLSKMDPEQSARIQRKMLEQ